MISRQPLKVLKVSPDCLLFYLEPVWLYSPLVKSIGQNVFQKIPFFFNSKLWTLLDFGMMSGQNIQTQNKTQSKDSFKDLEKIPGSIPFSEFDFTLFWQFFYYVITTHAVGHDVIGYPDLNKWKFPVLLSRKWKPFRLT